MHKLHRLRSAADASRIGRVAMLALVTASTAFGLGAALARAAFAGAMGGLASLGGFLLDDLLDRSRDRSGGLARNPVAAGALSPGAAVVIVAVAFAAAASIGALLDPLLLVPIALVAVVVALPGVGIAAGPVARAVSLGVLQALYAAMGGMVAGSTAATVVCIALFLFFAMTGGRVMGDVRDMPADRATGLRTIPIRYGMRFAGVFLLANEGAAYGWAIAAGVVGRLGSGYLACVILVAAAGTVVNILFLADPTPRRADLCNRLSLGLLGGLYTLGMVLAGLR